MYSVFKYLGIRNHRIYLGLPKKLGATKSNGSSSLFSILEKKTYVNKHQPVTHNSLQELGFHHPQPLQSQLDAFHLRSHGCVVAAHLVLQAPDAPAADFETAEGQLQG